MIEPDISDGADETKAETYEAMAIINRSFAQITAALYKLESKGVLGDDYSYNQEVTIRELAAKINCHIIASVNERELDDRKHYGKMRESLTRRHK